MVRKIRKRTKIWCYTNSKQLHKTESIQDISEYETQTEVCAE